MPQARPELNSLAVIVPLYNVMAQRGGDVLQATLGSIEASLTYFDHKYPQASAIQTEVVIVDDGSTDNTMEIVEQFAKDKPNYQLIKLPMNLGTAAARNFGVKFSQAQSLFFCDGDDRFLPEHIFIAFSVLNQPIAQSNSQGDYFGAVRTGVYTRDPLHPHWQKALENSIPLNLCVRREVHEFIGGFPEDAVFREFKYGTEDIAYTTWMQPFCHQAHLERKTVEYIRYPGSYFERQLAKFQAAPGLVNDDLSPADLARHQEINRIIQERLNQLHQQFNGPELELNRQEQVA
ncbi:glycosyltransferase family A protein [Thermosynechococcaceae cyanobacterium BACA0444]|uniref:Glycosyltransferase family A protein n=1 Tax=Pseudocalidococcus azoricus BACA0444 TaxID=2918990 RepID=A0AAE4K0I4_9CYAN|nr:glycosyltransferase family A protein [Pseudocalidococcus azoricus]MDS3862002.1 glycosyltransferase family A protein [Pseudocalidococcus azoricus BACA0444]